MAHYDDEEEDKKGGGVISEEALGEVLYEDSDEAEGLLSESLLDDEKAW